MEEKLFKATKLDNLYIAQCFVDISLYLRDIDNNIYTQGWSSSITQDIINIANHYIENPDALVMIMKDDTKNLGCMVSKIENTHFHSSGIGKVGNIIICWVPEKYRNRGISSRLLDETERWFKKKNINLIELSFLTKNNIAEKIWSRHGFRTIKTFSYKKI